MGAVSNAGSPAGDVAQDVIRGETMMKYITSAAALLGLVIAGPAFSQTTTQPSGATPPTKMSDAQCEVVWARINVAKAPAVTATQAESALSITNFKAADANNDGVVSHAEFLVACNEGKVSDTTGAGSRALQGTDTNQPKK